MSVDRNAPPTGTCWDPKVRLSEPMAGPTLGFLDSSAFFLFSIFLELLLPLFLPQSNGLQSLFVRNPLIRSRGRCNMLPKTRLALQAARVRAKVLVCRDNTGAEPIGERHRGERLTITGDPRAGADAQNAQCGVRLIHTRDGLMLQC